MIHTLLFDLDDTLYPPETGIMEQIRVLILKYIEMELNLPTDQADDLRDRYLSAYGTTLRGLQVNHQIDTDGFLRFVHDIPLHEYLGPNPVLDAVLADINLEKVVFTNATREHAERVLEVLGIRRHFSQIVDVRDVGFENKPRPEAYRRICKLLDVHPEQCALVEDNVRNLQPAKELGMTTILVWDGECAVCAAQTLDPGKAVDHVLPRIEDIGSIMAQLDPPS